MNRIAIALGVLLLLWGGSWALSGLPLGRAALGVAMAIALAKASVVLTAFMGLREASTGARLALLAGAVLLLTLVGLLSADVLERAEDPAATPRTVRAHAST